MEPARKLGRARGDDGGRYFALGIAIGISLGVAVGVAIQNIAVGIGCGVAVGVGIGSLIRWKTKRPSGREWHKQDHAPNSVQTRR